MLNAVVAHPVAQVAEVGSDKREAVVVDKASWPRRGAIGLLGLQHVLLGVGVLVEAEEMAVGTQPVYNLTGVAATTEGDVHIDAVGLDVKTVDALV